MQMFMAGGGTGPSLSTVALTQVTRSLDLNLSLMDTSTSVRRTLTVLHSLRRHSQADIFRNRFPPEAEPLEAILAIVLMEVMTLWSR